ncbi:MAG: putative bifunctional diguanylate cyclase/phosphodiesterase [Gammaproteobacteria bacterium]
MKDDLAGPASDSEDFPGKPVRILHLEDNLNDAELVEGEVRGAGIAYALQRVETREAFLQALAGEGLDLILSDFGLPSFDGLSALRLARKQCPEVPFIFVSGTIGEEAAIDALRHGASDYVLKARLSKLVPAMKRALSEAEDRAARERALRTEEARVYRLAFFDALTGLPNRALFEDRLAVSLSQARRAGRGVALLFLDLDKFKIINDTLGHPVGDRVLKGVAERLLACLRESDTAAHWSGDEFTILLTDLGAEQAEVAQGALMVAEKIRTALAEPLALEPHAVRVTGSLGIALCPWDAATGTDLIRHADNAMYHAKGQGRDACEFFTAEMTLAMRQRLSLETGLRYAIERGELRLDYQLQADAATGRWVGVEALLRWEHPDQGRLMPSTFIPIAEENRQILAIGDWVLKEALGQAGAWRAEGLSVPRLAVNVSPVEIRQPDFVELVQAALKETGPPGLCLAIEITKSVLIEDSETMHARLRAIRDLGVKLCIDDFGIGFSSLHCLKRWPVDIIKIDQSFIRDLSTNAADRAIVRAIVTLAEELGMEVIAEGVETGEQLAVLRESGCEGCQGYYFGHPMPAARFAEMLRRAAI